MLAKGHTKTCWLTSLPAILCLYLLIEGWFAEGQRLHLQNASPGDVFHSTSLLARFACDKGKKDLVFAFNVMKSTHYLPVCDLPSDGNLLPVGYSL